MVEMCKHPEEQRRLRDELLQFGGTDPTLDQLNTELPYLDAVVHEVLRVHPPLVETLMMVGSSFTRRRHS
jgi:cytochrome P450